MYSPFLECGYGGVQDHAARNMKPPKTESKDSPKGLVLKSSSTYMYILDTCDPHNLEWCIIPPSYGISYRDNREVEIEFETKSVLGIRPC